MLKEIISIFAWWFIPSLIVLFAVWVGMVWCIAKGTEDNLFDD